MPYPKKNKESRFWCKVRKTAGCWFWIAARFQQGYGVFQDEGKALRAHRVSWEMAHGKIPAGMHVLHTCDNPSCVRPDHLFIGTNADNMRDRDSKGRQAKGERHGSRTRPGRMPQGDEHYSRRRPELVPRGERSGRAKLTEKIVAQIRAEYVPYKVSYRALGEKYGVHAETIGYIIREQSWR